MRDQIYNHGQYELIQHDQVTDLDIHTEQLDCIKDRSVFEYFYDMMMHIDVHYILYGLYYEKKKKLIKIKHLKLYQNIELHESHFIGKKSKKMNINFGSKKS